MSISKENIQNREAISDEKTELEKGMCMEKAGKYESALDCFDKALLLKPDYADAWLLKGVILGKIGKCTESIKCYDKVVELDPNSASAWHLKAATFGIMNQYAKSTECDLKAIKLQPNNTEIRLSLAVSFQKLKKFEDAINCYEEVLKQKPDDAQIHYLIGIARGNEGDWKKAIDSFEQALKLDHCFTNALIAKGVVLAKLGRNDEAKLCAKEALKMKSESEKEESIKSNSMNDRIRQEYENAQKNFKGTFSPNPQIAVETAKSQNRNSTLEKKRKMDVE